MEKKPAINWDVIGRAFCEGKLTNTAIAAAHGITEGAIRRQAKRNGWKRGEPFPEKVLAFASKPPAPEIAEGTEPAELLEQLAARMLDELNSTTLAIGEMEDLIYNETHADRDGRRRAALLQAISLPNRAQTLARLTKALTDAKAAKAPAAKGKKETKADAAERVAAGGKFSPGRAPTLSVVGA